MADEELPYEHQLDEIATRVNRYRVDDIQPESFLMPTFLKYFPVAMELGVLPGIKWNNISGLFIWSPTLPMTYVDRDIFLAMSKQKVWEVATPEGYHPRQSGNGEALPCQSSVRADDSLRAICTGEAALPPCFDKLA